MAHCAELAPTSRVGESGATGWTEGSECRWCKQTKAAKLAAFEGQVAVPNLCHFCGTSARASLELPAHNDVEICERLCRCLSAAVPKIVGGSPTWTRTRDLRINRTAESGAGARKPKKGNKFFVVGTRRTDAPNPFRTCRRLARRTASTELPPSLRPNQSAGLLRA